MRFWNYIGEFLLFQWLFDKLWKSNKVGKNSGSNTVIDYVDVEESDYLHNFMRDNQDEIYDDYDYDRSFDDFYEEQDDYDMMDEFLNP